MRKFDPWPVFFKREFNRNWPFLVGFAITGTIITKLSLGLTGSFPLFHHFFCTRVSVWIWSDLKRLIQLIDYLILIYNCRRRSEKVRLCSEAQEVWNFIPNLIYCYYDFVTLDSNIRIIALCALMYAYSNRFLNQQTSRIYFITDSEYCFAN